MAVDDKFVLYIEENNYAAFFKWRWGIYPADTRYFFPSDRIRSGSCLTEKGARRRGAKVFRRFTAENNIRPQGRGYIVDVEAETAEDEFEALQRKLGGKNKP